MVAGLALPAFSDDRPNILFIFSDDHAPHAIGAYDGWLEFGSRYAIYNGVIGVGIKKRE